MFYFLSQGSTAIKLDLPLYLYSSEFKSVSNPIVINMIAVRYDVKNFVGVSYPLSCFSPNWGNTKFKPGSLDKGFKIWADKGLHKQIYMLITLLCHFWK